MRDGICPKCKSDNVYDDSSKGMFGTGETDFIKVSANLLVRVRQYVCVDCGYTESYVEQAKDLADIRKKWNRTSKRKRGE